MSVLRPLPVRPRDISSVHPLAWTPRWAMRATFGISVAPGATRPPRSPVSPQPNFAAMFAMPKPKLSGAKKSKAKKSGLHHVRCTTLRPTPNARPSCP